MTRSIGPDIRAAARFVLAGLVLLFAFTALYVTAFHAPRAKGVDIGVVGAPAQAARMQTALDAAGPGAFDVHRYDRRGGTRAPRCSTPTCTACSCPGRRAIGSSWPRPSARLRPMRSPRRCSTWPGRSAAPATVQDLRPLPAGDGRGLSSLFTVIGTLIPSLVFGVLLSVFGRAAGRRACAGPRSPPTRCSPGSSSRSTSTSSSARCPATSRGSRS